MKIFFFLFSFLVLNTPLNSQDLLEQKEIELNEKLLQLRSAKTDEEMDRLNLLFKADMSAFLNINGSFKYTFKHLKTVAILDSPDERVRIVNWNIEYTDQSYTYCAFVLSWDSKKKVALVTELIDNLDPYSAKPDGIIDAENWYGALYYKILPFLRNSKTEYLLLGWDGGTTMSNFKLIDVLSFNGSALKLGSPVFKQKKSVVNRVVFEYSENAKISLRYEDKYKRIVFDHLSPEAQGLEGVYSYYIPDMSYDCYFFDDEMWMLKEDVIAINDEQDKTGQLYIISKDGSLKKIKYKKKWLNPNNNKNSIDIQHVARTPISEEIQKKDKKNLTKEKRLKKNNNPNRMLITTGKYKPKKRKRKTN